MDLQTIERVRELNYDHHRRMTEMHLARVQTGENETIVKTDEQSYRTLLLMVPHDRQAILELGSASGGQWPLLKEWLASDGRISGIDLYEPSVTTAQMSGLDISLGFVEDMHMFPDASFDLVCSRHVLEHLGDPDDGLSEILRVTRPGGYIAHVTPNLDYDPEPAHLNQLDLQEWATTWMQLGVQLVSAQRHPFHGGEVHILGVKR
jgi:2-polyprenyl-3-methyl-5-hydroxy-6-metoxy-1,4-benzoquinol methylase